MNDRFTDGRIAPERVRTIRDGAPGEGTVIYWMSRDQRVRDNWALLAAQHRSLALRTPLVVGFCLAPEFLGAVPNQYRFMLDGLREVERDLRALGIPFILRLGDPPEEISKLARELKASLVVADQNPLRISRSWKNALAARLTIPMIEVDAHNIVPVWTASPKQEFGAYTLRPKLQRMLPDFLGEFPAVVRHPFALKRALPENPWDRALRSIGTSAAPTVKDIHPGETAAAAVLDDFVRHRLRRYDAERNDPVLDMQSHLSPYIHFGQLSAQRAALAVETAEAGAHGTAFLEELVVRRELSDNFCHFNEHYDAFEGFPAWAQRTLNEHRADIRTHQYRLREFEGAATHDELWNAAQRELLTTGRMHGFMRMYWAKKILEWTASPEEAMVVAIHLNDRYELDGRDPNGYAGIAWSIGGVHDRAWGERPVFGKIRYMNAAGCARKFNVKAYCARFPASIL